MAVASSPPAAASAAPAGRAEESGITVESASGSTGTATSAVRKIARRPTLASPAAPEVRTSPVTDAAVAAILSAMSLRKRTQYPAVSRSFICDQNRTGGLEKIKHTPPERGRKRRKSLFQSNTAGIRVVWLIGRKRFKMRHFFVCVNFFGAPSQAGTPDFKALRPTRPAIMLNAGP